MKLLTKHDLKILSPDTLGIIIVYFDDKPVGYVIYSLSYLKEFPWKLCFSLDNSDYEICEETLLDLFTHTTSLFKQRKIDFKLFEFS